MPEREGERRGLITEAERIAREFHRAYEDLAPEFGYRTRGESAKPWGQVPDKNRHLMIATVERLLENGYIGETPSEADKQVGDGPYTLCVDLVEKLADLDHPDSDWARHTITLSQIIEEAQFALSEMRRQPSALRSTEDRRDG